jgi:hypothetical protein
MTTDEAHQLIEAIPKELGAGVSEEPSEDLDSQQPPREGRFGMGKQTVPMPPNPNKVPGYPAQKDYNGYTPEQDNE